MHSAQTELLKLKSTDILQTVLSIVHDHLADCLGISFGQTSCKVVLLPVCPHTTVPKQIEHLFIMQTDCVCILPCTVYQLITVFSPELLTLVSIVLIKK